MEEYIEFNETDIFAKLLTLTTSSVSSSVTTGILEEHTRTEELSRLFTDFLNSEPELKSLLKQKDEEEFDEFKILVSKKTKEDDRTESLTFFMLRSSWVSVSLGLVGLTIGILTLSPAIPIPAIGLVRGLWMGLRKLERPEDDDAINAYEALLKTLKNVKKQNRKAKTVTTKMIFQTSCLKEKDIVRGLEKLLYHGIVTIEWAKKEFDLENMDNKWALQL